MTAIAEAFARGGITPPEDRLRDVALSVLRMSAEEWASDERRSWDDPVYRTKLWEISMTAIKQNPRNWEGARSSLYKAIRSDPDLLWTLFEPYRAMATQRLLTEAATLLRDQESKVLDLNLGKSRAAKNAGQPADGGHFPLGAQSRHAPVTTSRDAGASRQEPAPSRTKPIDHAPAPLPRLAAVAAVAQRLSSLDYVKIDGRPLRKMAVCDAREWASTNLRRARFIELVTANMPGNWIIGDHCPDDLADELWENAHAA